MPGKTHRSSRARLLIWAAVAVVLFGVLAGTVVYTERPAFCNVCHEMGPYYDVWATGQHAEVSCIDCHVDAGLTARFLHKFVALKEVWDHFTTKPTFPSLTVDVPDARCTQCHGAVDIEIAQGLTHSEHAKDLACQQCHAATGHKVTFAALDAAGILRAGMQPAGAVYVGVSLPATGTPAVLPGHTAVPCSDCHDMLRAQCSACHKAPKGHFGADCRVCHRSSVPFEEATFDHPRVEEHSYSDFTCGDCHPKGFASADCTKCHEGGAPQDD